MSYVNGGIFEGSDDLYTGGFTRSKFPLGLSDPNAYMALAGILILFSAIVVMFQWWGYSLSAKNNKNMTIVSGWATTFGLGALALSIALAFIKHKGHGLKLPGVEITF